MFCIVYIEHSPDNYKSWKMHIGAIMKNPETIRFVPDDLETKKMFKNAAKKLLFAITYFSDWYKTQEMCNKIIEENVGTLNFITTRIKKCIMKLLIIMVMH